MSASDWVPTRKTLPSLRAASRGCEGCDLYRNATQTVFGEGAPGAHLVLVGEQPGDREDVEGAPFVGPAGAVLDRALQRAGIARADVYVTNAVKHFKYEPRGKRRLHKRPNAEEVRACRPWLDAELAVVKPTIVVALGATAAQALLGSAFRVTKERGTFFGTDPMITATVHPSSILRAPDDEARHEAMEGLVADLTRVARKLARLTARAG